jgi:hypothetical protein
LVDKLLPQEEIQENNLHPSLSLFYLAIILDFPFFHLLLSPSLSLTLLFIFSVRVAIGPLIRLNQPNLAFFKQLFRNEIIWLLGHFFAFSYLEENSIFLAKFQQNLVFLKTASGQIWPFFQDLETLFSISLLLYVLFGLLLPPPLFLLCLQTNCPKFPGGNTINDKKD